MVLLAQDQQKKKGGKKLCLSTEQSKMLNLSSPLKIYLWLSFWNSFLWWLRHAQCL